MHFANNYALIQPGNQMIYLLLTNYPDRVSRFLKKLGMWKFSHISVSTSMVDSDFYSFVGKKGFRIEQPLLHPTFRGQPVECELYAIPVTDEVCSIVTEKLKWHVAIAHTYKYSYFGLVMTYFGISLRMKNKYTCAGFVAELLKESAGFIHMKYHRMLTPDKFKSHFRENLVFKGTIEAMLLAMNKAKKIE